MGGAGLGGIKSQGSRVVGLTDLEIFVPISEKKLLNSSAISCWLFDACPFIRILSI